MPSPKRIVILFLFALLCMVQPVHGIADTARTISPGQWQQLTTDKAFSYRNDKEAVQEPKNYEPSAMQKFFSSLFTYLGEAGGGYLVWAIVLCIALYIIYTVFLRNESLLFARKKKIKNTSETAVEEEADLIDTHWEKLLQQALASNDLRLATRYSYMRLLQLLQQRNFIRYRNDKTNFEYYTELKETAYKQPFKQLSRQYEYAWYGGYALPEPAFKEYMELFNNVKKQLGA